MLSEGGEDVLHEGIWHSELVNVGRSRLQGFGEYEWLFCEVKILVVLYFLLQPSAPDETDVISAAALCHHQAKEMTTDDATVLQQRQGQRCDPSRKKRTC